MLVNQGYLTQDRNWASQKRIKCRNHAGLSINYRRKTNKFLHTGDCRSAVVTMILAQTEEVASVHAKVGCQTFEPVSSVLLLLTLKLA